MALLELEQRYAAAGLRHTDGELHTQVGETITILTGSSSVATAR